MGEKLLSLLYPDHHWFYVGLALGALPLSRLLLPKLWQTVSLTFQLWGVFVLLLADILSQAYLMNLHHWRFEALSALTLWLSLMFAFIVVKAGLERQ